MKINQGKNLGWMKIKREILKAVISGENTRERLKAIFAPNIVSTKDVDYHLRGTSEKPGLIRRGILKEKNGRLFLNLQTTEKLREILEDYLLSFPEYRRALDLEFSACFLSKFGDFMTAVHGLSDEQTRALWAYYDWAHGYRQNNNEKIEESIMKLASELSAKTRGHLNDSDKISYVLAFHSLIVLAPSMEDDLYSEVEWRDTYDGMSTTEITLAWKDVNLIREEVKEYSKTPIWVIKMVFDRLHGLAIHDPEKKVFPDDMIEDPGIMEASEIINMVMYEYIDRLAFNAGLFNWINYIGYTYDYKREIIKIMASPGYIPERERKRLGKILKDFNDSQTDMAKHFMAGIGRTLDRYHGKMKP